MKRSSARVLVCAGLFAAAMATQAAAGADPYGTWLRPDDGTTFTFYKCGAVGLCVKVKGVRDPADRKLIGSMVFTGAEKIADNAWKGQVFNSEDGQSYIGKITVTGPSTLTLEGCALGGAICKGENWTRTK